MLIKIYGRDSCPYCLRAKSLAAKLKNTLDGVDYQYIDVIEKQITKQDLSELVGLPVHTVPQIFIDDKPIGGCTDFQALIEEQYSITV